MPYAHPSGLSRAYDRAAAGAMPDAGRLVVPEGVFVQGANLNELQRIIERRSRRLGNLTAADGDRISEAGILVNVPAGTATLAAGDIYVRGDVRPVAAATLTGIQMTGRTTIGIRLVTALVTHEGDPSLLGLDPGAWSEAEPGAAREDETIAWALPDDGGAGDYYPVYTLVDGVVIDQTEPPLLTGINAAIALYDRQAHGNYIVEGCNVTALGKLGTAQIFAIEAGIANIAGAKRTRSAALRHAETEAPDLEVITAETHSFTADPTVIVTNRPAIAAVSQVVVVKTTTQTIVRGAIAGGLDELAHASVTEVVALSQGAITYLAGTDYVLAGDAISWAPGGAEPVASSTYNVTYRYHEAVAPDAVTDMTVTVSGGTIGTNVQLTYTSKIPRTDLLCLDSDGHSRYVKGISARKGRIAPPAPTTLLKLAEIDNDWLGLPSIRNNGTTRVTFDMMWRRIAQLEQLVQQFSRANLASNVPDRVSARSVFIDHFADDSYRDQGAAQTAAIRDGSLQLAVDVVGRINFVAEPLTLAWSEVVILSQPLRTSDMLINPYASLTRMEAGLRLEPPTDFFVEQETVWTSAETQTFGGTGAVLSSATITEVVSERAEIATTMRQIDVAFSIEGFGAGEILQSLTFDDVDVTPDPPLVAGGAGQISGTFTIPEGMPTGTRLVRAEGQAGSFATALFVGSGSIEIDVMRKVTLVTRATTATRVDPLAQTFALDEARHVVGVDFWIAAIGDPTRVIRVQIVTVQNGVPTTEAIAEAVVDFSGAAAGDKLEARFGAPVFIPDTRMYAVVWMTDDPAHRIAITRLGDVFVDPVTGLQTFVGSQAYTVGDMFSSSNHESWLVHPSADVAFELVGAEFAPAARTVVLGTLDLDTVSDIALFGVPELPTADTGVRFELVRAGGQVVPLAAGQTVPFSDYLTELVTLRAVLVGTDKVSPILWPGVQVALGRIRASGTYVGRAWPLGTGVDVKALVEAYLPSGSSLTVEHDAADNTWHAMAPVATEDLGNGWVEPLYEHAGVTAVEGRIRLTLTGTPAGRPQIAQLRAYPW